MELNCENCGQKFHIPDHRIDDRRVYFFCEKCNNKVLVEREKEPWSHYEGLKADKLTARDLLAGLFYSFNFKSTITSFIFLICLTLFVSIAGFIFYENMAFLLSRPFLLSLYIFSWVLVCSFSLDTMLYLVSKNIFHRMEHGSSISYSKYKSEIANDLKTIFIISCGLLLTFAIISMPAYPLGRFGILYTGIVNPLIIVVLIFILLTMIFKPIIISFIALRSRSTRFAFKSLFRFAAVENINILAYALLNMTVMNFAIIFVILLAGAAAAGSAMPAIVSAAPELITKLASSPESTIKDFSAITGDGTIKAGLIFMAFWMFLFALFSISYIISAGQSLCAASIRIMESNPGRSVSRAGILAALFGLLLLGASSWAAVKSLILAVPKF